MVHIDEQARVNWSFVCEASVIKRTSKSLHHTLTGMNMDDEIST